MASNFAESPAPDSDTIQEMHNKSIVNNLYKSLSCGDTNNVAKLVASDLEWWFHRPPRCHHMMRMLTGESSHTAFRFEPKSVEVVGDCVIAEGWDGAQVYWVHVWTLKDGLITQFREYFNTWLVVRDLRPPRWEIRPYGRNLLTLWQSHPRDLARRSLPGLVLAI